MEGDSIVKIQVPDVPPIELPIIYRENKDGSFNTNSVFESMSLSTVVQHKKKMYRLRMPNARNYIDKSIKVTVHDAAEQTSKNSFYYENEPILNYRRLQIKRDNEGTLPSRILDPSHEDEESSSSAYSMVDNTTQGMKNITLDCFAIELGGSSDFLTYIAGEWYISFSNFFKFFSEDYRRKGIDDIAEKVKKIHNKNDIHLYVQRKDVDALIEETYPIWSGYNEKRLSRIGKREFFSAEQVKTIIKDHMTGASSKNEITPYPETQWERGPGKAFEKEKDRIMKAVDEAFWKYVSLRPAWDTKERFDTFFEKLGLNPEDYYENLSFQMKRLEPETDDLGDPFESDDLADPFSDATPEPTYVKTYVFIGVSYEDIKRWVGSSKVDDYVKKYTRKILEELKIMDEDIPSILNKLFEQDTDSLTVFKLQEAMQNQARIRPGKFDLFVTLAKAVGVDTSDDDPERVLEDLKAQLKTAEDELKSLALRKEYLLRFIQEESEPGSAEDQDADDMIQKSNTRTFTKNTALDELQEIDDKLAELRKPKKNKITKLKRQIHAMKDPKWVTMRHVLKRIGVDASNKAAVKTNAVFTIQEFYDMLTKMSGKTPDTELNKVLKEKQDELARLRSENTVEDEKTIRKKIEEIRDELNETHKNFGYPDRASHVPNRFLDPQTELNSKHLFRGNKGKKLDAFVKKWMARVPQYKFKWDPRDNVNYGITYFNGQWKRKLKKMGVKIPRKPTIEFLEKHGVNQPEMLMSLALARENTLETTYLTLLHEIGHAIVGKLGTSDQNDEEQAKADHGPRWFKKTNQLFKEYFAEVNKKPTREPEQFHSFIPWKKVKQVERYKGSRQIVKVFYDTGAKEPSPDYNSLTEVVTYDPKDYSDLNYAGVDRYNTRKTQRAEKTRLEKEIETLQNKLFNRKAEDTKEMKMLIEEIKEIEGQLNINAVEHFKDRNVKIMVELANYIRDKVGSPDDIRSMVRNICHLYSATSSFKDDMKKIITDAENAENAKGEIKWIEKNNIRSFNNYMGALVSVHYVSDNSDDNTLKARSAERSLNGIPIALRYAMFLDGVHPDYLPKLPFEKLKKFGRPAKRSSEDFLFADKTKRVGLYNDTGQTFDPPSTKNEFEAFHAKAESILSQTKIFGTDSRDKKPRRRRERKKRKIVDLTEPTVDVDSITIYEELPDFLSITKAAIEENMNKKPGVIPKQRAAECAVHAVNNLLGSKYTLEQFQMVQGTEQWFKDITIGIILGNPGILLGNRWVGGTENRLLCIKYQIYVFERYASQFMDDPNLVGMILFLGPDDEGHWTSMKKWSPDGFTYMDSYKQSETSSGGFVKTLPKDVMIQYILNEATYGDYNVKGFFAVYKDEISLNRARQNIEMLERDREKGEATLVDLVSDGTEGAEADDDTGGVEGDDDTGGFTPGGWTESETESEAEPEAESEAESETESETESEAESEAEPEAESEAEPEKVSGENITYKDNDKEALVDYVLSNRSALYGDAQDYIGGREGMRERCWAFIQLNVDIRIKELASEDGKTNEKDFKDYLEEFAECPLDYKKKIIKNILQI